MSPLAEEFGRFAGCFSEPLLLVTSSGRICAANHAALELLSEPAQGGELGSLFDVVADPPEKIHTYLRLCSRSAAPLPGRFTFSKSGSVDTQYRCVGCAHRRREVRDDPLILLRLYKKDAASSRFAWLNDQIDQLKTEVGRRLSAERAADQQRQLWQVTLSSIGDAVIATDTEGRVTFMNPVAATHIGLPTESCIGRPLEQVFVVRNEDTGNIVESPVQRVLESGVAVGLANHTVLVRADGEELPIDDSAAPIRDAAGNLFGVILVFHEVAESRRLQRELLKHAESLREADRRKDEFLAVLAHELRNPLAPLSSGLHVLRRDGKPEDSAARVLEMMERQLSHLVRLVDDLMDLNRITHGRIDLKMAPVGIRDVLMRSLEGVAPDLEARGHEITADFPQHDIVLMGDGDRLTQVFTNLLANSIKYSDDGARITVGVEARAGEVVVDVSDNGIGIPADQLARVFEMFSQVRAHQRRAQGGLGIGLAVARTLVRQHGGTIDVRSPGPGLGTTVTVRLPIPAAHEVRSNTVRAPSQTTAPGSGLRIVVADDNADAAESLRMVLEGMMHEVRVARNGLEAVEITRVFAPNLIFMDVGMPEMDGLEATRRIRSESNGDTPVIVALTGWGQTHDRERTRQAGANRHVVKPVSAEELEQICAMVRPRLADN